MSTAAADSRNIFFFLNNQYKINGRFKIKVIGKNKPKKDKGINVLTEIKGDKQDNKRSNPKYRFRIKIVLSNNDKSFTD
ncbi:MAG: hypothetical protein KJO53_07620 [Eudoraea sp.]|nr:hypothetical protein [Eudoraea sp.]NNL03179.1 hypothetical protein [Eudoraea sp.]